GRGGVVGVRCWGGAGGGAGGGADGRAEGGVPAAAARGRAGPHIRRPGAEGPVAPGGAEPVGGGGQPPQGGGDERRAVRRGAGEAADREVIPGEPGASATG